LSYSALVSQVILPQKRENLSNAAMPNLTLDDIERVPAIARQTWCEWFGAIGDQSAMGIGGGGAGMNSPVTAAFSQAQSASRSGGLIGGYELRALLQEEFDQWDEFVKHSPQGTLFHSTLWLQAAAVPFVLYGCFRGGRLCGGCAVELVGEGAAAHSALTPYLGVLFQRPNAKYVTTLSTNKEIAAALAIFLKNQFSSLELRLPPEVEDLQPFLWQGFHAGVRYTYRLLLPDLDVVLHNMDSARRRNLGTAERAGVTIDSGAAFSDVMGLTEQSFRRQGLTVGFRDAALRFNAALEKAGHCRGFLARDRHGTALASVWIVWDEKRAYYLIGGYDDASRTNGAMPLAMWHAIRFTALELKLREFDFEGSMIPAVERFFRKFGGTLRPTYTLTYRKPASFGRRLVRRALQLAALSPRVPA
jgi:hypothetical protein